MKKGNTKKNDDSDNEGEEKIKDSDFFIYDPSLSDRIICIELENKQKIYLNYTTNMRIKEILKKAMNSKEYRLLNYNRDNIMNIDNSQVDFSLSFYEDLKPRYENKISLEYEVNDLHAQKFLKSHKSPFLSLKDNFMVYSYIYSNDNYFEELKRIKKNNYNQMAKYFHYLPRQCKFVPNLYYAYIELQNYFDLK